MFVAVVKCDRSRDGVGMLVTVGLVAVVTDMKMRVMVVMGAGLYLMTMIVRVLVLQLMPEGRRPNSWRVFSGKVTC